MADRSLSAGQQYVLGNEPHELARLDRQAALLEGPTRLLLQASGISAGMRVLDLGTGLGHVARLVGELVGPAGSVVGIDRASGVLAVARERTIAARMPHVTFVEGDATTWRASQPFDAVIGRLLLFHVADPAAVVRHHIENLRPGGRFIAVEFDIGAARSEPSLPLFETALQWIDEGFRTAGAWPRIGGTLHRIFDAAGLRQINALGVQLYFGPDDPTGPQLLGGVIRSLAPAIIKHGIATAEEIDLDTLERRMAASLKEANAVLLPPTVAGAWGEAPR
jgi:protein-L-isoaspartate O-methyltransferase